MKVVVDALTRRYGERVALDGVSFEAASGETFGLLGPNGSGKSTLFKILSTSLAPGSGTARIGDVDIRNPAVRRHLGVVFQSPALDKKLTVAENLLCHGHLYGLRGAELRGRIDDLLKTFGIADRAGERVEKLSGGLARRVELAKALLHRPGVLLLDEPSTGLDPGARRDLWDLLRGLRDVTVLLTTHLLEEAERCARVGILHQGKLVALGTPDVLRGEIGGEVVTLRSRDPVRLAENVKARFGLDAERGDGTLRLSREKGAAFAAEVVAAFPELVEAVSVAKPSLEDVFHARTREDWR
ncbi:MAG TPA: ABC transporter ATP-binding protein [Planctomycetota bacterium]